LQLVGGEHAIVVVFGIGVSTVRVLVVEWGKSVSRSVGASSLQRVVNTPTTLDGCLSPAVQYEERAVIQVGWMVGWLVGWLAGWIGLAGRRVEEEEEEGRRKHCMADETNEDR
jgi:hypothetical protein